MKSFEEMLLSPKTVEASVPEVEIPDRIYNDPMLVGYPTLDFQMDTYFHTMHGNLPLTDTVSITDVGAGRGDIVMYLHEYHGFGPGKIQYTGYEINPILATAGNKLLNAGGYDAIIHNTNFIDADVNETDIVLLVGTLNIDYGIGNTGWQFLENLLKKCIKISKFRVIAVLLHENAGYDQYNAYPIPNMTELALKFNHPFTINYGVIDYSYVLSFNTSVNIN